MRVDAESLAVHPQTGDIFVITKNYQFKPKKAFASHLFRLSRTVWEAAQDGAVVEMEWVALFDLLEVIPKSLDPKWPDWVYQVATAMDISPDGKRLLVLNYINAVEFDFDLEQLKESVTSANPRIIPLEVQPTQEAIAYDSLDGSSFLYSSEVNLDIDPDKPAAELSSVVCIPDTAVQN
jgi:hypothetical protein